MSHVLVTGGSGFIGTHICIALIEKGYKLVVLDNQVNSSFKSLVRIEKFFSKKINSLEKKISFYDVDLRDFKKLVYIFSTFKRNNIFIDCVIHLAGLKDMNKSFSNAIDYWDNNVLGSINLFKVMDKNNCRNLVFSSSAAIYDSRVTHRFKEDSKKYPLNPYGLTKLTIEKILKDLYNSSNNPWKIINLRYFNPVGAHNSGSFGEDPLDKSSNLFPLLTKVAVGKLDFLNIYGSDWPTSDGTPVRDFIHIMDLAEVHLMSMEYLVQHRRKYISINVGSGDGTSVLKLVKTFEKENICKIPIRFCERRKGDSAVLVANNSLAKEILNWYPKRNLQDICRDGWKWQKQNPNGY